MGGEERRGAAPGGASRPRGAAPLPPLPRRGSSPAGWAGGRGERRGADGSPGPSQGGPAVPSPGGGRAGPGGRRREPVAADARVRARVPSLCPVPAGGEREDGTRASAWPLRLSPSSPAGRVDQPAGPALPPGRRGGGGPAGSTSRPARRPPGTHAPALCRRAREAAAARPVDLPAGLHAPLDLRVGCWIDVFSGF